MKPPIIISLLFLFACTDNRHSVGQALEDTAKIIDKTNVTDTSSIVKNIWKDRLNNKYPLPDTIGGKPVQFYLENQKVAKIAKALYKGDFRPEDNDSTTLLLSLVVTDDHIIRPFYRWCLDFTITISDGALAEYPGVPALKYATKFPEEFFAYMDKDTSGQRYKNWTEIIGYSGVDGSSMTSFEITKRLTSQFLRNCANCSADIKRRISIFSNDIVKANGLQD